MEYFLIVAAFFVTLLATFCTTKSANGGVTLAGYGFILLSLVIVVSSIIETSNKAKQDKELLRVANRAFINQLVITRVKIAKYKIYLSCREYRGQINRQDALNSEIKELNANHRKIELEGVHSTGADVCFYEAVLKKPETDWLSIRHELEQLLNRYSQTVDPYSQYLTGELTVELGSFSDPTMNDITETDFSVQALAEIFAEKVSIHCV